MNETKTQVELIKSYFERGGSLTVLEALQHPFYCYALSQRVGNLIKEGYPVHKDWVDLPNGKRIRRYSKGFQLTAS